MKVKSSTKTHKAKKRSKNLTVASLKKKADAIFSIYIRLRDKKCITCGSTENLQCGHFQSRKHNATRYDPYNCQAQCVRCNMFNWGEQYEFGKQLDKKYGDGMAESLKKKAQEIHKFTTYELQDIIDTYKKEVEELGG